jgi:hypothetical protein
VGHEEAEIEACPTGDITFQSRKDSIPRARGKQDSKTQPSLLPFTVTKPVTSREISKEVAPRDTNKVFEESFRALNSALEFPYCC